MKFNERTEPTAVNQLVVSGMKTTDYNSMLGQRGDQYWSCRQYDRVGPDRRGGDHRHQRLDSRARFGAHHRPELSHPIRYTVLASSQFAAILPIILVNTLQGGASSLVNADLNEESANLLSLQTRQQLGTISLQIAQKSEEVDPPSILRGRTFRTADFTASLIRSILRLGAGGMSWGGAGRVGPGVQSWLSQFPAAYTLGSRLLPQQPNVVST